MDRPDGRYLVFLKLGPGGCHRWRVALGAHRRRRFAADAQRRQDRRHRNFSPEANRLAFVVDGAFVVRAEHLYGRDDRGERPVEGRQPERFSPPQFLKSRRRFLLTGDGLPSQRSKAAGTKSRRALAPAGGVRFERQVSTNGGRNPRWSRVKSELLYQSGDQIIAVPFVAKGDTWEPGKPAVRVEKLGGLAWDLAADGRIAVVMPVAPAGGKALPPENTIAMVQNSSTKCAAR